jgi:predicted nucleic acid-binding protein
LRRLVLDCSVCAAWLFNEDAGGYPMVVLRELDAGEAVVPSLWPYEVANALVIAERRRRLSASEALHCLEMLSGLRVSVDSQPVREVLDRLLPLAKQYQLTAYDAAYLELAIREGLELATLDEALRRATLAAGAKLFQVAAAGTP